MSKLILILVSGGILAGLVNYFVIIKNLKFIDPNKELESELENATVPTDKGFFSKLWQFLKDHSVFFGYIIVGVAGALLTPLIDALLGLKGLEDLKSILTPTVIPDPAVISAPAAQPQVKVLTPYIQLVLLGYALVFGVFAIRILSSVVAPLVSKLSQIVVGQQKEIKALSERASSPGFQGLSERAPRVFPEQALLPSSFSDIINLPAGGLNGFAKGVDISHHNGTVNWKSLKSAGIEFVYIKISEGVGTFDPKAPANANAAKSEGFKIGYYHFGRPDNKVGGTPESDAKAEAAYLNSLLASLPVADLPIMLDLEDVGGANPWDSPLPPATYHKWVQAFMDDLNYLPTKIPIIYSRKNYLDSKLSTNHSLAIHPLWVALYNKDYNKAMPVKGWDNWQIWQFTEAGDIEFAKFDFNIWKRDHFNTVV